jgi:hypothetical protein
MHSSAFGRGNLKPEIGTYTKLRGWVNDGENPWVNDPENPHLHKIPDTSGAPPNTLKKPDRKLQFLPVSGKKLAGIRISCGFF